MPLSPRFASGRGTCLARYLVLPSPAFNARLSCPLSLLAPCSLLLPRRVIQSLLPLPSLRVSTELPTRLLLVVSLRYVLRSLPPSPSAAPLFPCLASSSRCSSPSSTTRLAITRGYGDTHTPAHILHYPLQHLPHHPDAMRVPPPPSFPARLCPRPTPWSDCLALQPPSRPRDLELAPHPCRPILPCSATFDKRSAVPADEDKAMQDSSKRDKTGRALHPWLGPAR